MSALHYHSSVNRFLPLLAVLLSCLPTTALSNTGDALPDRPAINSKWSHSDRSKLRRLSLKEPLTAPDSPSNRYADDPAAAALGKKLFFDVRLSGDGTQSCASCHKPELDFSDGHAIATGTKLTLRNAPGLLGTANYKWWYWDGRADSLWSQALIPLEAPDEMASSRAAVLKIFSTDNELVDAYKALFGALPNQAVIDELPTQAGPLGDLKTRTAWYRIDEEHRAAINRFYANIGKAIAAYERTLQLPISRFDQFAQLILRQPVMEAGSSTVSTDLYSNEEIFGLRLYLDDDKTHCRNCHNGKLLSNSEFYDVGSAQLSGRHTDHGRSLGLAAAKRSEFNCMSDYSDVEPTARHRDCRLMRIHDSDENILAMGAFKTPTLRRVKNTAPYFHNGSLETLEDVVRHYQQLDMSAESGQRQIGRDIAREKEKHQLPPMNLSEDEISALIAFLNTL